jgi:type II secretion system protein G
MVAVGFLLVAVSAQASSTLHGATEYDIRQLDGCVMTFGLEHGRYPSQSEGLSLLVTGFPGETAKNSGYIKALPKDGWDRDFVYRFPSLHNTNGPDIYSLGEDGISKTGGNDPDDINNWSQGRPWSTYYNRPPLLERLLPWLIGCGIVSVFGFLFLVGRNGRRADATVSSP